MTLWLFEPAFVAWGAATSWLELIAVVLAFACVVFNVLENAWGWPLAVVSCVLYTVLFAHHKLYGDAGVQVFFALAALWAWWQWLFGRRRPATVDAVPLEPALPHLTIASLGWRNSVWIVAAWLVLWPSIGWILNRVTDSDVPYFDAFPTAGSVIGQVLLGRKYIENWLVWFVVNLASVALLGYKALYLSAGLYVVFVAMAWIGWRRWSTKLSSQSSS